VSESNAFFQATYPVADDGFSGPSTSAIRGKKGKGQFFVQKDFARALIRAQKSTGATDIKRAIMVVPQGYVEYHDVSTNPTPSCCIKSDGRKSCAVGFQIPGFITVGIQEGYWTTGAHEIGHSFGINLNKEDYTKASICGEPATNNLPPVSGYFVERMQGVNAFDFMGTDPGHQGLGPPTTRWVSNAHWLKLMDKLDYNIKDPEILNIGAVFSKDDSVELLPWFQSEGVPSLPTIEGNHRIEFIDDMEEVLLTIPFGLHYEMFWSSRTGHIYQRRFIFNRRLSTVSCV